MSTTGLLESVVLIPECAASWNVTKTRFRDVKTYIWVVKLTRGLTDLTNHMHMLKHPCEEVNLGHKLEWKRVSLRVCVCSFTRAGVKGLALTLSPLFPACKMWKKCAAKQSARKSEPGQIHKNPWLCQACSSFDQHGLVCFTLAIGKGFQNNSCT